MASASLRSRARAFTIVEVLVVLMIFSIVLAMATVVTRGIATAQKRSTTSTRLAGVDAALVQFVAVQKRLPCPADGTLASTSANAGIEPGGQPDAANGCTAQQNGVVPWRALGISEQDATDGWDRRFTYRVWPVLGATAPAGMDMSWCDPAGTGGLVGGTCNNACTSSTLPNCTPPLPFLQNKGFLIKNVAGTNVMDPVAVPPTGAAYVVISPGESGGGGYLNSGVLSSSNTTDGTEETTRNYADKAVVAGTYYVDDTINDVAGVNHFDDVVSRPSVQSVASKAGLGPRPH